MRIKVTGEEYYTHYKKEQKKNDLLWSVIVALLAVIAFSYFGSHYIAYSLA